MLKRRRSCATGKDTPIMSDDLARFDAYAADADAPVSPAELDAAYADFAADLEARDQVARELYDAFMRNDYSRINEFGPNAEKQAVLRKAITEIDALRRPPPPLTPLEQAAAEWAGLTPEQYAELKGARS